MKALVAKVDEIVYAVCSSTEAAKVLDMNIGANVTGPGSKATQYDTDILFSAYRVLCNTPDFGVYAHQILIKGDYAKIKVIFLVADVGHVAFEALLRLQGSI